MDISVQRGDRGATGGPAGLHIAPGVTDVPGLLRRTADQGTGMEDGLWVRFALFAGVSADDAGGAPMQVHRLDQRIRQPGGLVGDDAPGDIALLEQFEESLVATEPIAKRLGFLLQEMHREVNTTGSKSTNLDITKSVLRLKEELENMREQIQNLE